MPNLNAPSLVPSDILNSLACEHAVCFDFTAAVIVAHPDDEVLAMGGHFDLLKNAYFVHVTDGSPRSMYDAHRYGFATRAAYAYARQCEFASALQIANIDLNRAVEIGIVDQEAFSCMLNVIHELVDILSYISPDVIFTHAYEGGHPDHDSVSLAVHAACELLRRDSLKTPLLFEFGLYHGLNGAMRKFEFLPAGGQSQTVLNKTLSPRRQALKTRLINCFKTQAQTLGLFDLDRECFRPAPVYDFTQPPHPGPLYYENFDWGTTGQIWRQKAKAAIDSLGLGEVL